MKTLRRNDCQLIGYNAKKQPVFFGKKESDDPHSRDLTLWYTIELPRIDGENYHRVPARSEIAWSDGSFPTLEAWINHLRTALNLTA